VVMENKHMVDGDGVGDDGGEEALNLLLWSWKWRSWWSWLSISWKSPSSPEDRFSGYIRTCTKGEAETATEAQTDPGGATYFLARATWSHLHTSGFLMAHFKSFCSYQNLQAVLSDLALFWVP
jgi:hypothetical protein